MKKVLVLDDCPVSLTMATRILQQGGYEVRDCSDSTMALMLILNEQFDAIVTDIEMPGISGWELIRIVRSWTKTALIPVIFLTKLTGEEDKIRGFSLGADDYLTKPVRRQPLLEHLQGALDATEIYLRHVGRKLSLHVEFTESVSMFGIPSFLSLLEAHAKSGLIHIEHGRHRAKLSVAAGKIHGAEMVNHPECSGLAAISQILGWASGYYRFAPGPVTTANLINQSTTQILLAEANATSRNATLVHLMPSASGRQVALARMARRGMGTILRGKRTVPTMSPIPE